MMWSVEVVCVRGTREWTSTGRLGELADSMGIASYVAHTFLDGDFVVFTGPRAGVVHSGRMGVEDYEPSPHERKWLDSLAPEQRESAMDMLTTRWRFVQQTAECADQMVDLLLPHAGNDAAIDNLMSFALHAEGFRELARGNSELADEHFESALRYRVAPGSIRIVLHPDDDEGTVDRPM